MNIVKRTMPKKSDFLSRTLDIEQPPKTIWYMGKIPENAPSVAIVGSRKPTEYGKYVTLKLASELASRGIIIVSGLALGHDALAARGALDGEGTTVAILGSSIDEITPKSNYDLAMEILKNNGAIISEYPHGTIYNKDMHRQRNRIISALADVVVVVEAGLKSGTLNTSMHALEQNRELMVVPGNITSPLSVGCNKLLSQGASPVTSVDDVLEKLGLTPSASTPLPFTKDKSQNLIIEFIKSGTTDGDEIIKNGGLTASEFNRSITMLELAGVVRSLGANRWILK